MLIGLSVLSSLLSSGVGVQEALRRASTVGGPFCNLLGLLVARMEVEDFTKAIEVTRAHLPDPTDVEAQLFLRDIYDGQGRELRRTPGWHAATHMRDVSENERLLAHRRAAEPAYVTELGE